MIENILIGLLVGCTASIFGVIFWSILGYKVTARNLRKEFVAFLENEFPHMIEDEEFRARIRAALRIILQEGGAALLEEFKRMKKGGK